MREDLISIVPATMQNTSENTATDIAIADPEAQEDDDSVYYSDIVEYLLLEAESNAKHVDEWAAKKSVDPSKWLRIMKRRACNYCILNGLLHHGRGNPKPVIIQRNEQLKILKEAHIEESSGIHIGVSKMYSALCTQHFWRGLYRDVKNYVRSCGNCVEIPGSNVGSSHISLKNSAGWRCFDNIEKPDATTEKEGSVSNNPVKLRKSSEFRVLSKASDRRDETGIWKRVEMNLLVPDQMEGKCDQSLVVIADSESRWLSAQVLTMSPSLEEISESAAMFAFSTFCTLGFPNICTVVEESNLQVELMWQKMKSMSKSITFDSLSEKANVCGSDFKEDETKLSKTNPPTLTSLAGISLEQEVQTQPPITLNSTSISSCNWAWDTMRKYITENADSWASGLDAFLFEERRKETCRQKSAFFNMFGRLPFHSDRNENPLEERKIKSKRRKLRSSVFECRHCEESFTSRISFQMHQKKHTEDAMLRGLIDEDMADEECDNASISELSNENECAPQKLQSSDVNASSVEDISTKSSKKEVHHHSKSTSYNRRKTLIKMGGVKKHYQKGITRLLALAQVSRSIAARGACDEIPRDSSRASFTAQTVASVRASLEAKRKKHIRRGNYQRYSPELREEIAKYALDNGINQTMNHFSATLGGKPISESTVRNFVRAYCSPTNRHGCLRNKELEDEIGRFSALAGTEAAVRYYSSRLGYEIKRGTVSRLRRAYLKKHPEDISKRTARKKTELNRRKRRYSTVLREEIGSYAAQHGVGAAVQHYSERLLFPIHERTITKFLKMHLERENHKSSEHSVDPNQTLLEKPPCLSTHDGQSLDMLNHTVDVLGGLHHNHEMDRLDQGNTVSHLMYGENSYVGLHHAIPHEHQVGSVGFHDGNSAVYEDQHSANHVILDQNISVNFCGSQELSYHPVQNYSNFENSGMQVPMGPLGMEHSIHSNSSETVNLAIHSTHQDMSVASVSMSHVASQFSGMVVSHHSLISSQSNSNSTQNNHQQIIIPQEEAGPEQVSSQNNQMLEPSDSSTLTALLPSSTYVHSKSQNMASPLMSHSSNRTMLGNADLSSLHKSLEREMIPSYYPLTMTTSQEYDMENSGLSDSIQMDKHHVSSVCENTQPLILSEPMMPSSMENEKVKEGVKDTESNSEACEKIVCFGVNSQSVGEERTSSLTCGEASEMTVGKSGCSFSENLQKGPEESSSAAPKGNPRQKKPQTLKESRKKCLQKPKRGNYNFFSPELRARIGKYAAEHGNLQAAKHFQAEVGRQIPESTIRGLRDKYVMKQMHVAASAQSGLECGDSQKEVTALGYAPRGRPMVLGKYDEIVQDCMHELVKSGEKVGSMLAITTARQVLTQYEPTLLEEFGGPVKLNNSWAKSFIKRIGLSNNS